jgi:hypothetical protein
MNLILLDVLILFRPTWGRLKLNYGLENVGLSPCSMFARVPPTSHQANVMGSIGLSAILIAVILGSTPKIFNSLSQSTLPEQERQVFYFTEALQLKFRINNK